ncbi:MAG TPA: N-acetylmuramoyl-L-alanine amidase [Candidatus Angelobacter sp.]|nr:N-acetylmuramoyl-L-alanine amidase [Candidatus Angelobacter sp.]
MRWNRLRIIIIAAAGLCCALEIAGAGNDQQLTVYTAQKSYSLPVFDRDGQPYIAVEDLLLPLGAAPPRMKGKEWRFELNKIDVRLTDGKEKALMHSGPFDLGGKVRVENDRVLVPMAAALPMLTRLLSTSVDFHQPARRIFVGNIFTRFTASYSNGQTPSLVLNFTQPVTPDRNREEVSGAFFTHTDRMTLRFKKEPVVGDPKPQQFGDGAIQSLDFREDNGAATITITGNTKLKVLRSDDGRTITLQPETAVTAAQPQPSPTPLSAEMQRHPPEFFVMIDPSHGGFDKGAALGGRQLEKDVTLKMARDLRKELEEHGIASRMLRDSDVDVDLARRAEITNEQHAGIYVALHAAAAGRGVRVYWALLANPQAAPLGRFLPWETAQATALDRSKSIAQAVSAELRKKGLTVATMGASLRPLNNIVTPAIAVEVASDSGSTQSQENARRTSVVSGIADAIVQVRGQIGTHP